MLLKIDLQSDVPIYVQLYNEIIEGIASGALEPGEPLPSVRHLASDLGINLHTVNKSYSLLKQEGFIQIHRQKGALVHPEPLPKADESFFLKLGEQLRPLVAESLCRQVNEEQFLEQCRMMYKQLNKGRE